MSREQSLARADDVARAAYGTLVAMLAGRSGDIMAAEDALSDAFLAALRTWPERGVPKNPEAWLLAVARNKSIDQSRKAARLVVTSEVPDLPDRTEAESGDIHDERLKLLFVCAHPAIDAGIRTPLMLQTVLGLEADVIARAFLISPTAMSQRLVRAKRKIKTAGIPFAVPDATSYAERMAAVLEAVYAAYAVDWFEGSGDLSHEAFFLATILSGLAPDDPEALGLDALIGFIEARRNARLCDGVLVPVPEQKTDLWDDQLIARSNHLLKQASAKGRMGRFQLEAAIQSVHAARGATGRTDWRALSQLYLGLMQSFPTLGAAVSHAAVVAEDAGAEEGLRLLEKIDFSDVSRYQPFYAVRAECLSRLGDRDRAADAYAKALSLCTDQPSRRWLESKLRALHEAAP